MGWAKSKSPPLIRNLQDRYDSLPSVRPLMLGLGWINSGCAALLAAKTSQCYRIPRLR